MSQFEGIIFDFNGVLWWDSRLHEQAWRDFSVQVRGYPLSMAEMALHVHGRNNRDILDYLSERELDAAEYARLGDEKEQIYRRLCLDQGEGFRLSPGAEPLLDFLVEKGIAHTIATASDKGNVDFYIEHLRLARWFDLQKIVYDDGTMASKPAPDFYLAAAEKLGLEPGRCVVVEDSHSGVQAARAAGIGRVLALVGDHEHTPAGDLPGVDGVIRNFWGLDRGMFRNAALGGSG